LKVHLGLVVPQPDYTATSTEPNTEKEKRWCTSITVGGEERTWVEGKGVLFDDSFLHHVWNNCSTHRVVLQAVFTHPGLSTAGAGVGAGGSPGVRSEL
jgi:aspartyl/asparaginyl beta-hydroxylase (cupin superfamily)